jgi:hypothetical protein
VVDDSIRFVGVLTGFMGIFARGSAENRFASSDTNSLFLPNFPRNSSAHDLKRLDRVRRRPV